MYVPGFAMRCGGGGRGWCVRAVLSLIEADVGFLPSIHCSVHLGEQNWMVEKHPFRHVVGSLLLSQDPSLVGQDLFFTEVPQAPRLILCYEQACHRGHHRFGDGCRRCSHVIPQPLYFVGVGLHESKT